MTTAPDIHDAPDRTLMDACVHCGFCLPACPTYALWGEEMDSPRGRIYLMRAVADGRARLDSSVVQHFDACLGCMACVTACPSGVQYGPLIERTRAQIEAAPRPVWERLWRAALFAILPYPVRVRLALVPALLLGRVAGRWAPLMLAKGLSLAALFRRLPDHAAAVGEVRLRAGLLAGCVQRAALPNVNLATLRVLAAEGCETIVPRGQGCCGALSRHAGRLEEARAFARATIERFEARDVDAVVVNAAGCGSSMKEYPELFAGDAAWEARARAFSSRVRDVTELLVALGEPRALRHRVEAVVAYHDACHLAHAQGIRSQPRALLAGIPGVTLADVNDGEMCCGSAGIYNLVQPQAAAALGELKARRLLALQPDIVASANPGCTLQIAAACERAGRRLEVLHPIELLDRSIQGGSAARSV